MCKCVWVQPALQVPLSQYSIYAKTLLPGSLAKETPQFTLPSRTRTDWRIPSEMLHPRNPLNRDTQIPRYKFNLNQSQFECVPRDTAESEFLDFEDFGGDAFWAEIVSRSFIPEILTWWQSLLKPRVFFAKETWEIMLFVGKNQEEDQ